MNLLGACCGAVCAAMGWERPETTTNAANATTTPTPASTAREILLGS
jgi:hypothetical protein